MLNLWGILFVGFYRGHDGYVDDLFLLTVIKVRPALAARNTAINRYMHMLTSCDYFEFVDLTHAILYCVMTINRSRVGGFCKNASVSLTFSLTWSDEIRFWREFLLSSYLIYTQLTFGGGTSKDERTKQVFEASPGLTPSLIRPPYPISLLSLLSQAGNVKEESPSLGRESCEWT